MKVPHFARRSTTLKAIQRQIEYMDQMEARRISLRAGKNPLLLATHEMLTREIAEERVILEKLRGGVVSVNVVAPLALLVLLMVFLFEGDPDPWDTLREWAISKGCKEDIPTLVLPPGSFWIEPKEKHKKKDISA